MSTKPQPTNDEFDEIPELTPEKLKDAFYIDPDGLCHINVWIDYDVYTWLEGLEGSFDYKVNEILREQMEQSHTKPKRRGFK